MTQIHQTQCPHCQHSFQVTDEDLALKSGFARCNNCHKIFSAIDSLPASAVSEKLTSETFTKNSITGHKPVSRSNNGSNNASVPTRPQPTTIKSPQPTLSNAAQTPAQTLTAGLADKDDGSLLFDDHSGLDEDGSHVVQAKSPAYQASAANTRARSKQPQSEDFEIIDNFDSLPSTHPTGFVAPANSGQDNDEAWLDNLLAEENQQPVAISPLDDKLTRVHKDANDVSSLLDELGIDVNEEQGPSDDEYLQRVNARFQKQTSSQKHVKTNSTGMAVVWGIGSLLLAGLLAAQYFIFNAESMLKNPNSAQRLKSICGLSPINCHLPLADLSLIDTTTLSVEPTKTDAKKTDLIIALKNTASEPNLYPNLKVTLRAGNETKAQFIVPTSQYTEKDNSLLMPEQIKPLKFRIDYPKQQFDQANVDLYY